MIILGAVAAGMGIAGAVEAPVVLWDHITKATSDRTTTLLVRPRHNGRTFYGGAGVGTDTTERTRWVLGSRGRAVGKWYFEARFHDARRRQFYIGIGTAASDGAGTGTLGNYAGQLGIRQDGMLFKTDDQGTVTTAGAGPAFGPGDTLGVVVDCSSNPSGVLVWVRAGSGLWNNSPAADPAAGVGGHLLRNEKASGSAPSAVHPMLCIADQAAPHRYGASLFANVGEQLGAAPAGFVHWDNRPAGGPALANIEARRLWQAWHHAADIRPARLALIDHAISGLKADGVWPKLGRLWFLAAHEYAAALYNWVDGRAAYWDPSLHVSNASYFGWAADTHFKGTAQGWLTAGLENELAQNDSHMGVISRTATVDGGQNLSGEFGGLNAYLGSMTDNTGGNGGVVAQAMATAGDAFADVSVLGHLLWSRASASQAELYKNGVLAKTLATASAAPTSGTVYIGRIGTSALNFSKNELVAVHSGQALTAAEAAALNSRLEAYRAAILAPEAPEELPNVVQTDTFDGGAIPANYALNTGSLLVVDRANATAGTTKALTFSDVSDGQLRAITFDVVANSANRTLQLMGEVSSEAEYDFMFVSIDSVEVYRASGTQALNWTSEPLALGTHKVRVGYSKDVSGSVGEDNVWISKLVYPRAP